MVFQIFIYAYEILFRELVAHQLRSVLLYTICSHVAATVCLLTPLKVFKINV